MPHRIIPLRATVLIGAVLLAGCLSKEAPETRYYLLGALDEAQALDGAERPDPLSVEIATLRVPQYLERPHIVTRVDANRVAMSEYDLWGGNLEKNLIRVLSMNLTTLLGTPDVYANGRRPGTQAGVRIDIDLLRFERGPDDRARLEAQWRVARRGTSGPAASRITRLTSGPIEPGPAMDSTVAAMTALVGELSRAIATAVLEETGG